jgi:hypothetical protein
LQDKIDSSGMPRTTRGLFLAASLLVLWLVAGWVQTGLGAFVAATYWRTWLAPKQVSSGWCLGCGAWGGTVGWHPSGLRGNALYKTSNGRPYNWRT